MHASSSNFRVYAGNEYTLCVMSLLRCKKKYSAQSAPRNRTRCLGSHMMCDASLLALGSANIRTYAVNTSETVAHSRRDLQNR